MAWLIECEPGAVSGCRLLRDDEIRDIAQLDPNWDTMGASKNDENSTTEHDL